MSPCVSAPTAPSARDVLPNLVSLDGSIITCLLVCSPPDRYNLIFSICSRCVCALRLGAWGLLDAWEKEWMLQTQEVGVTSHSATRSISFFLPAAAHLALFLMQGRGPCVIRATSL